MAAGLLLIILAVLGFGLLVGLVVLVVWLLGRNAPPPTRRSSDPGLPPHV